jgi:hypothetical protein
VLTNAHAAAPGAEFNNLIPDLFPEMHPLLRILILILIYIYIYIVSIYIYMGGLLSAAIKYIPSVPASGAAWAFVRNCPDFNTNLCTRISLNSATSNVN